MGIIETARFLLEISADITAHRDGYSALMLASQGGHTEVVNELISAGVDLEAKNDDGKTALMIASAYNEHPEVVDTLISAGANIGAKNDDGRTALMIASAYNEHPEVSTALISAGTIIEAKANNDYGWTALMAAKEGRYTEIVELLKDAGAIE